MLNPDQLKALRSLSLVETLAYYDRAEEEGRNTKKLTEVVRLLVLSDLYYMLVRVCGRVDMINEFAFARCREVEGSPDGMLDLWAREHWKSSVITFGLTIQNILQNQEVTIGIFSHTRPIAKAFLRQIMREFETNQKLHATFPDVLYGKDVRNAQKWALDVETPVLTVKGWKKHGDLLPGDQIFGSSGQVITVTGISGHMVGVDCLRLVLDDCEFIASADHLWPVQCKTMSKWDKAKLRIKRTHELKRSKSERLLATPILKPAPQWLTLAPYILGLWLGDGTAGTNIISMHRDDEPEVLEQIALAGFEAYVHRRKEKDNFSMYGVRGLKEKIEAIGCLWQKHIPQKYLLSGQSDRLALLQGLMDSDGTCKKESRWKAAGMCMFSNTNTDLANGALHLAASLGLRPSIVSFMPKSRKRKQTNQVYFVGIKGIPPFRLKRKLENCKDKRVKTGRYIRTIEKTESVTVNCIKVDSDDSLYLAGHSLVPTHNSEDDGIIVKRKSNPNEATVEAWGLVDGQPVSKHFAILLYDDIVVQGSVTTPEMIQKTMTALEQSYSLGKSDGTGRRRFAGTRWHFNDAYRTIKERGSAIPREHPGRIGGTEDGESVFWSEEMHQQKRRDMGEFTYAAQILLNPAADAAQGFKREWIKHYTNLGDISKMNTYILVDSASSKKKGSDYTAMIVVGLGTDGNYYIIDMVRDRLNLSERLSRLFMLHRKYKPKQVRFERYGMLSDIDAIKGRQEQENYRFTVTEVAGQTSKKDRIRRLIPLFEQGKVWLPKSLHVADWQKQTVDLVRSFIEEEYAAFPSGLHDDQMDALARLCEPDLSLSWPMEVKNKPSIKQVMGGAQSWMG